MDDNQIKQDIKAYVKKRHAKQEMLKEYGTRANDTFKVAKNFSVQFYNNCIPKNAVYGKPTRNLVVYIDDFEQFKPINHNTRFHIYVLDKRKATRFEPSIVKIDTEWYKLIYTYIHNHNLFDVKCIPVNCVHRGNDDVPNRRVVGNYQYRVPFAKHGGVNKYGFYIPTPEEHRGY